MGDFGICFLKSSLANAKTEERFRGYFRDALKFGNILVSDSKEAIGGKVDVFVDGSIYNKKTVPRSSACLRNDRSAPMA